MQSARAAVRHSLVCGGDGLRYRQRRNRRWRYSPGGVRSRGRCGAAHMR